MPKANLEVTFSISPEAFPDLVRVVKEQFDILPVRIDSPELPYPDKRIFINYRRADSQDICGRIYDRLEQAFGKESVFRDVVNLLPGYDFRPTLEYEITRCHIMLVIMGRQWANGKNRERLHEDTDYVRLEIETALKRNIPVIPIWVGGRSSMPSQKHLPVSLHGLLHRQARQARPDPDFHTDMDKLITDIKAIFEMQTGG